MTHGDGNGKSRPSGAPLPAGPSNDEIDVKARKSEIKKNEDVIDLTSYEEGRDQEDQELDNVSELSEMQDLNEDGRKDSEPYMAEDWDIEGIENAFRDIMLLPPQYDSNERHNKKQDVNAFRDIMLLPPQHDSHGRHTKNQAKAEVLRGTKRSGPKKQDEPEVLRGTKRSGPTNSNPLSWRLNPQESLSDWQIKVVRAESGKVDLYHVHRMVLAVGPRQSGYFANLFLNEIKDHGIQRLRLEMPDEFADTFPVVLDFIYGENDIQSVEKRKHAFSIYEQAEHFQMLGLKSAVANWFRRRLQWFDVPRFLEDIQRFDDSMLVKVAVEQCALQFEEYGPQFAAKIEPSILLKVFELLGSSQYIFHHQADYVAELIVQCCQAHQVDHDTLQRLTDQQFLPVVPTGAITRLLALESEWRHAESCRLSGLEDRCVRSLERNWKTLCCEFPSAKDMAESLSTLPPAVLAELLVRTSDGPW